MTRLLYWQGFAWNTYTIVIQVQCYVWYAILPECLHSLAVVTKKNLLLLQVLHDLRWVLPFHCWEYNSTANQNERHFVSLMKTSKEDDSFLSLMLCRRKFIHAKNIKKKKWLFTPTYTRSKKCKNFTLHINE
jgi:hypothetical protein